MAYRGRNEEGWPMEWVSEGSRALLGIDPDRFVGSGGRFEELIVASDRQRVWEEVQRSVDRAEPFHSIYRIRTADARTRWVSDHGVATRGTRPRIEGFISDVTAVRDLEQRLQSSQRLEALGELAGSIAHDFNNVLAVVIAGTEASLHSIRQGREAGVEKNLTAALDAAKRAASLTRRLMGIARRRPVETDWSELDVRAWLTGCLDALSLSAGGGTEVRFTADAGETLVRGDPDQLLQALLNLAINARDAMGGSGNLHVHCGVTEVDALFVEGRELLSPGSYVTISVTDTGPGIPPERLGRVFEPFFTTKPEGTGLGLATVYSVARQHGGLVTAYSRVGEGTTFRLYLPALHPTPESTEPARGGRGTVLVVEDQDSLRELIVEVLSEHGYAVIEARDAETAIGLLSPDQPPDVLLTDVGLPGAQGPELAESVLSRHPGVRVIFMSGYRGPGEVDPILKKPFSVDMLLRVIEQSLAG
jgi:signal transduction histidine kinase/CheY-like chemotaxis protein